MLTFFFSKKSQKKSRLQAWQLSGIFLGIVRHLLWDRQGFLGRLSGNFFGISFFIAGVENIFYLQNLLFEEKNSVIVFQADKYSF